VVIRQPKLQTDTSIAVAGALSMSTILQQHELRSTKLSQREGANHIQVWGGDSDVFHPDCDQVAHYYRFEELKFGWLYRPGDSPQTGPTGDSISIDWNAVHPMRANPRTSDHAAGSPIRLAQEEFNRSYCELCNFSNGRLMVLHRRSGRRWERCTP
jgi:hypothetical protein